MTTLRHLNTAIQIFQGTDLVKRGRTYMVEVHWFKGGDYMVQAGSRVVEQGNGALEHATKLGTDKAASLRNLTGKPWDVVVYGDA